MSQQPRYFSLSHLIAAALDAMSDNEVEELWNRPQSPETRRRRTRLLLKRKGRRILPLEPHDFQKMTLP